MKLIKSLVLALAACAAGALHAQTPATAPAASATGAPPVPAGVLGRQYAELNFGFDDVKHTDRDANTFALTGNRPITSNFDGQLTYSYSWLQHSPRAHANALDATAVAFTKLNALIPFATATLGYSWDSLPFGLSDDYATWGLAIGAEIPLGDFTLTPRIGYEDDFETSGRSAQEINYGVEANYWLNRSFSLFGRIGYADVRHSQFDRWTYNLGVRMRF